MHKMFSECKAFNTDLSSWIVSKVTDMMAMFNNADVFNSSKRMLDLFFMQHSSHFLPETKLFNISLFDRHFVVGHITRH